MTGTVGKVELISTFTTVVCESWNVSENTLGIMLEVLSNYPWTRHSVRIIGVIKRQLFDTVTHVFDNSNLLQEIFGIDTWRGVIWSLEHGRKHILTISPTIWRPYDDKLWSIRR